MLYNVDMLGVILNYTNKCMCFLYNISYVIPIYHRAREKVSI